VDRVIIPYICESSDSNDSERDVSDIDFEREEKKVFKIALKSF
jgi:hypothetical protein